MSDSRPLAQQIQELEVYIESLVDSLQQGERPVGLKPVRQVVDRIFTQEIPPLQLPPEKFIELYNDLPIILSAYAITVNLTAESYNSKDYRQAIFHRQPQGNYWMVMTKIDRGWLVPNPNKNTSSLGSLNFAFDLPSSAQSPGNLAKLLLPAVAQLLPTEPTTWKITQRGQLGEARSGGFAITDTSALEAEIRMLRQELHSTVKSLQAKDASIDKRLNEFKSALQGAISTLKTKDAGLEERMEGFKAALQGLIQKQGK
jgi:hypothetical protein